MSLILPIVTTAASLAGAGFAAAKSAEAHNKARGMLDERYSELEGFMDSEYHRNAMEEKEALSALGRVRDQHADMLSGFKNNAVSNQATPEAQVAAQGEMSKNHADAIGQILAAVQGKKDHMRMGRETQLNSLFGAKLNMAVQQAGVWDTLMQNIAGASGGIMDAWAQGAFKKTTTPG